MRDRGEPGTSMKNQGNDFNPHFDGEQHFRGDPRGDLRGHRAPYDDWMSGGGRGRRRAMMMAMMADPSGMSYGMDHGQFGFGGRGGGGRRGHGGWFGFGGRGRGFGGRGRGGHGQNCQRFMVDDDDEYVTSMAEQMNECQLNEGCKRDGCGSSESSSSSSSSESDDEQHAPNDDVQGRQPHDGEGLEKEGKSTDQTQQETTKSNATDLEKEQPSSDQCCDHGCHGRRHGRGHHKHHHGKHHMHHHHHHNNALHHYMIPPHLHGFNRPPFPPMHHSHHGVPHCHGNRRHMAKKFFKRSMKKWYKAEKRAWKQQQGGHCCHQVQRSDEDEAATSGCDNDDDIAHPETQCQLPPPWLFFSHDRHGCEHGRCGSCRHGKKGKRHGKRLRQCNCERPRPAEDTNTQTATKTQVDVAEEAEVLDDDQAPMDDIAQ